MRLVQEIEWDAAGNVRGEPEGIWWSGSGLEMACDSFYVNHAGRRRLERDSDLRAECEGKDWSQIADREHLQQRQHSRTVRLDSPSPSAFHLRGDASQAELQFD